jgi:hypothetical protein
MRTHKRRPAHILQKARAEVAALFDEAEALWRQGDEKLARRRVAQARKHAMKVQLRIPEQGDRFLQALRLDIDSWEKCLLSCEGWLQNKNMQRMWWCQETSPC